MLAKDKATVQKHRKKARQLIREITKREGFKITERIKFGPRYFVAKGLYQGNECIFKICLYPQSYDHLTNEKFSREIIFLDFIQHSKYHSLAKTTPALLKSNTKTRAWYIRELLDQQPQNINGGNIRFKDSFFNTKNLNWFVDTFIKELHKVKKPELPSAFKKLLFPPQTLEYMWRFISPYKKQLERFTAHKGSLKKIHKIFKQNSLIYRRSPRVLAHQEVYSPHILIKGSEIKMIDWENVGWATLTHDVVTLWMRAYHHPRWQQKLKKAFFEKNRKVKNLKKLWETTVLLQSTFNVISYHFYDEKKDFLPLAKASKKIINDYLK